MWCIETIIRLNDKAIELAENGRPISEAFAEVGINMPRTADQVYKQKSLYISKEKVVA